jgi:phosphomannomutase
MTVLQLISEEGKPVSEVIGPIDTRYRSGEINTRVADAKSVMADVEKRYAAEGATIDHLDGVTIGFPDWWFNLRASNTEPLLRLNAEAETPELLATKTAEVRSMIPAS